MLVAVADGISTSRFSEIGASIASNAAVQLLHERLREQDPTSIDAVALFTEASQQMRAVATQRNIAESDICCALITAVVTAYPTQPDGAHAAYLAWVGDVSALRLRAGRWSHLAGDRKGGTPGELDSNAVHNPLPFGAEETRTTTVILAPGDALVVVTDGVGDGLATLPGLRRHLADRWSVPPTVSAFLDDVGYDAERFIDDRTAVALWVNAAGAPGTSVTKHLVRSPVDNSQGLFASEPQGWAAQPANSTPVTDKTSGNTLRASVTA